MKSTRQSVVAFLLLAVYSLAAGQNAGQERPADPAALRDLRSAVDRGQYLQWKAKNPVRARKGIGLAIERLGAFEAADRRDASDIIQRIGIDGLDAMVRALGHPILAVRAAVYEQLTRRLTTEHRLAPAALPIYDAWAPARQRSKMAVEWQRWWAEHRTRGLTPNPSHTGNSAVYLFGLPNPGREVSSG